MADLSITAVDVSASQNDGALIRTVKANATIVVGDAVYEVGTVSTDSGTPYVADSKANNTDWASSQAIGVMVNSADWYGNTSIAAQANGSCCTFGPVWLPGATLTPGKLYYASDNAGKISDTPSTTHPWIIGQALDADVLFVNPRGTGSTNY